ncbi:MAG: hypothetical protein E7050_02135 [Lentisphaerae bacterium]|nr:hypothetical protein [Lentisphaerota bacterium]
MDKKNLVVVCGANPAWQKTLFFSEVIPGKVNRAVKEENYPSGKGVNFCRALRCSGLADSCLIQFAGGINGQRLCSGLDSAGFKHVTIPVKAETRNCITCLDANGNMTELIGVSHRVLPEEGVDFLEKLNILLDNADIFAITGSLPDNSDPEIYVKAVKSAVEKKVTLLLDTLVRLDYILSLPGKMILKVNKEEFFKITGKDDIIAAHCWANNKYPGKIFAVTDGENFATLSIEKSLWKYGLPSVSVVNPLGAGDTASAVMSGALVSGISPQESFRLALAAASANCQTPTAGEYSLETAAFFAEQITITQHKLPVQL